MRLLHTSDWHLGHVLHDRSRDFEHAQFLDWLLGTLEHEAPDALLLTGDVFDTANPPASAEAAFYCFLGEAHRRLPTLQVVVIAGNHDSASRLDAPHPVLASLGVRVVGSPRRADGELDLERLIVPLRDRSGAIAAWVAAVPFLRPGDLDATEGVEPLIAGTRRLYAEVLAAVRGQRETGQALVVTGHCYVAGTSLSELSERKILGGNQHALPLDVFPDDLAYAALGHLHLAQVVGGKAHVRYAGSPIPLSLAEASYQHQVCVVDLDGERCAGVRPLEVPRSVEIVRLPEAGAALLPELLEALRSLPERPEEMSEEERPFLEVRVRLDGPAPLLAKELNDALAGKAAKLARIEPVAAGSGAGLAEVTVARSLADLDELQVLEALYAASHTGSLPADLREAFLELVDEVKRAEPAQGRAA